MLLSKNSRTPIGNRLFGLMCAAIAFIATFTVDRIKALRRRLAPEVQDAVLTPEQAEQVRQSFFSATFSIMGHVAKADGAIRKSQIAAADSVMERMGLSAQRRAHAIELFNKGKQSDFELDRQVKRFRDGCADSADMYRVFLETQIEIALADGNMASKEEAILVHVAKVLGYSKADYRQLEVLVRVSLGLGDNHNNRYRSVSPQSQQRSSTSKVKRIGLQDACGVLGVKHDDQRATVKAAYRKLMNQHHPDKLESKGLPEEMLRLSTHKVQEIQKAYNQIKLVNGWQ